MIYQRTNATRRPPTLGLVLALGAIAAGFSCDGATKEKTEQEGDTETDDATAFLIELSEAHTEIITALSAAVDYDEIAVCASLEDGEDVVFWSGELDADGIDGIDGVTAISGEGLYERQDSTFRDVYWTLDIDYDDLQAGGHTLSGQATFDVHESLFEESNEYHDLDGSFVWDETSHSVAYSSFFASSVMQEIEGALDDTYVFWETDQPSSP